MQDNWNPTPYRVVHRFKDNVYGIKLADGSGPIRNVTRREICDTGKPDLVQMNLIQKLLRTAIRVLEDGM